MSQDVWVVIPSAVPQRFVDGFKAWHSLGYKVAVHVQQPDTLETVKRLGPCIDRIFYYSWEGLYKSYNKMIQVLIGDNNVIVQASDDIYPDLNHTAKQLEGMFIERFPNLYGIMQPQGDKFGNSMAAVSPWIGRNWIINEYGGAGPFYSKYNHYFGDEELFRLAKKKGVLYTPKKVTQYHDHWTRNKQSIPPHLDDCQSKKRQDQILFQKRRKELGI